MADFNLSANMSLPIPIPLVSPGPNYALQLDASLTLIDVHDHSLGFGVQITPAGININTDLPFNDNNATALRTVRLQAQTSVPGVSPDLLVIYAVGADLYYNDGVGNVIRITQAGSVTGSSGTITGLPSGTASASYSAGPGKFIWQSSSLTGADMDFASAIIREKVMNGKGVTLSAPAGLAADYTLIFPPALPVALRFATIDNAGNIAATLNVDNSTLEISSNLVQVKDSGITTAKIADGAVTSAKLAALTYASSAGSGAFTTTSTVFVPVTNLSVAIANAGRPISITLVPTGGPYTFVGGFLVVAGGFGAGLEIRRSGTAIATYFFGNLGGGDGATPPGGFSFIDVAPPNVWTYTVHVRSIAGQTVQVNDCSLVAYRL